MIQGKWETISNNYADGDTAVMKVPNGWLIKYNSYIFETGSHIGKMSAPCITFMYDKDHVWEKDNWEELKSNQMPKNCDCQ